MFTNITICTFHKPLDFLYPDCKGGFHYAEYNDTIKSIHPFG